MDKVDVAIIGAGTAGLAAYRAVTAAGKSAVIVDHGPLGTTCARVGCMPSKLLLQAAHVAQSARDSAQFGIAVGTVAVDERAVFARVRAERDRFVSLVNQGIGDIGVRNGTAIFTSPETIAVDGELLQANAFVVAVGSSPTMPEPLRGLPVLTSDTIFELEKIPRRLAVVGAGAIALELGQAMSQLGAEVTFFTNDDKVAFISDPKIRASALANLGLNLNLESKLTAARIADTTWTLVFGTHEREFDAVLVAAGRTRKLAALDLGKAGLDPRQPMFDTRTMRCGDSRIFLAGDAAGDRPILHEAADEGRIAGDNAAHFPHVKKAARRMPIAVIFTAPQIAFVGERFSELEQPHVGEVDFADQGRARVMGQNRGLLRIYADRSSGTLRGAELIGPEVEHLAHLLAWSFTHQPTASDLLQMPFYHPVLEEGVRTALKQLAGLAVSTGSDLDCGAGT